MVLFGCGGARAEQKFQKLPIENLDCNVCPNHPSEWNPFRISIHTQIGLEHRESAMNKTSALRYLAAFACCAAIPTPGWAAAVVESSASGATATDELAEVVVTANRVAERLQDVPITVTAISGEELASQGIYN